jgi:hypothetical protein
LPRAIIALPDQARNDEGWVTKIRRKRLFLFERDITAKGKAPFV